ncbi:MAG: DUF1156 domain-containing protein [Deltaproteobacteria bacterium]|nr:DUF1156 domain-containing protein [Deltaproteobacteria bacterium]
MDRYCKRLIEVDLPIKRISAHARREKSIRHGHISTLHIWWARRPLAACRAVICASLWPDPADELCPDIFRKVAREQMTKWATDYLTQVSQDSWSRFVAISKDARKLDDLIELRSALLDFIADFANWDNSTVSEYLETSRILTQTAHEALGGERGSRPLVVDPFAGGGSIPLEALRVGAYAFASDLNPVAVLLNKVVLEYIPKYGQKLADEVRKWGQWIKEQAEKELAEFYPKDPDGSTPIAYLWARVIQCEGPGCGAVIPMMRSLWLAKKGKKSTALRLVPDHDSKKIRIEIIENATANDVSIGTVARGAATCPVCGFTTPSQAVRKQLKDAEGGSSSARLIAVRRDDPKTGERGFRLATAVDMQIDAEAAQKLKVIVETNKSELSLVPDEKVNPLPHSVNRLPMYGMTTWGNVFTPRQALALSTFSTTVARLDMSTGFEGSRELMDAVKTSLALAVDRLVDFNSSLCVLNSVGGRGVVHTFGRQALPIVWDFMETNPFNEVGANWNAGIEAFCSTIENEKCIVNQGVAQEASATSHPLPDACAQLLFTDPPYYDMISYADLSDFFYVWLKRTLSHDRSLWSMFKDHETPKEKEIIVEPTPVGLVGIKNNEFYLSKMSLAMSEARRVIAPEGLSVVVFAHKSTSGWEAQLEALLKSGWIVTGSWPIDTERTARLSAIGQARLNSSIHLVCRPRENPDGSLCTDDIGNWRNVLIELPKRIQEWMPRLAEEGVVGADAIFACLGPALEIYSRYSSVEKASGEKVELKEYLEEVWAAVSREALNMIFDGADASGFEEDARLTAMWLWTLKTTVNGGNGGTDDSTDVKSLPGYSLEYDAARKIAQGLGAHLDKLTHLVETRGDTAMLLSTAARTQYLFGRGSTAASQGTRREKAQQMQFNFTDELQQNEEESGIWGGDLTGKPGSTVLDQLHQSMILFAAGRSEAMKRFLVEGGVGRNPLFWRLAQALSALYPAGTDEKRWVDGVLARKKGLGL